ncbi:MAG: NAD(P)H-hydrate epimerase, partial [Planctomycetes bacterium]|nr:NAD(P)H-hydrate epimerase [Planctomycetota bacterium]
VDPARFAGDACTEYSIARRSGIAITAEPTVAELARELAPFGVLVDALLGTGFEGVVREPCAGWIRCANDARGRGAFVAALDLPSGLDADLGTGREGCVRADLTLGFAAPKLAFELPACAAVLGEVLILSIGAPSGAAPLG